MFHWQLESIHECVPQSRRPKLRTTKTGMAVTTCFCCCVHLSRRESRHCSTSLRAVKWPTAGGRGVRRTAEKEKSAADNVGPYIGLLSSPMLCRLRQTRMCLQLCRFSCCEQYPHLHENWRVTTRTLCYNELPVRSLCTYDTNAIQYNKI